VKLHATPQNRLDRETLPLPNNISAISPASLSHETSNLLTHGEDIEMEGAADVRPGKGGKIIALKGTYIEVLDRFRNLAPILDAVLADTDESGQVRSKPCYSAHTERQLGSLVSNYHMLRWCQYRSSQYCAYRCGLPGTGRHQRIAECRTGLCYTQCF
jgi:hypothetical protein